MKIKFSNFKKKQNFFLFNFLVQTLQYFQKNSVNENISKPLSKVANNQPIFFFIVLALLPKPDENWFIISWICPKTHLSTDLCCHIIKRQQGIFCQFSFKLQLQEWGHTNWKVSLSLVSVLFLGFVYITN